MLWAFNRIVFSCDIPYTCDIHPSVQFPHNALGVVVHPKSRIGENTIILQNVTIGGNMSKKAFYDGQEITYPIIGCNVLIGAGASILGPVIVGDNSQVGAGSVLLRDVPSHGVALGLPAKIVKVLNKEVNSPSPILEFSVNLDDNKTKAILEHP